MNPQFRLMTVAATAALYTLRIGVFIRVEEPVTDRPLSRDAPECRSQ